MSKKDSKPVKKNLSQQRAQEKQQKATEKQEVKDAYELIRLRNYFYRDSYRRLVGLLLFLAVTVILLVSEVIYLYKHQPPPRYFATNVQGQLMELESMNKPSLSQAELLDWARRAVVSAYTFNYVQYRQQLETAKDTYFTEQGGEDYLTALDTSKILARVREAQLIVTVEPLEAPNVIQSGVLNRGEYKNRYFWQVTMPVKVIEQNPGLIRSRTMEVQLVIVRSSLFVDREAVTFDGVKGIGIAQFIAKFSDNVV